MEQYPHRIETPAGVRYGVPVEVEGRRVTYEMVPMDDATYERVCDEIAAEFHRLVLEADPGLPRRTSEA
jgi:hypothetical protein